MLINEKIDSASSQSTSNKNHRLAPYEKRMQQDGHNYTTYDISRTASSESNANQSQPNHSNSSDESRPAFNTQAKAQNYKKFTSEANYSNESIPNDAYYIEKRYHNETQELNTLTHCQNLAEYDSNTNNMNFCLSQQSNDTNLSRNMPKSNCQDRFVASEMKETNLVGEVNKKESYACPENYTATQHKPYDHKQ